MLHIFWTWIVAGMILVGLLITECTKAHAELYMDLGAGVTSFINTLPDGVWVQRGLNYSLDTQALAWKVGAGYRFTDQLALQISYVNLGTTRVHSTFLDDAVYDLKTKTCTGTPAQCNATGNLTASDAMQGVELTGSYRWKRDGLSPYLKAGAAWMLHRFTIENYNQSFAQKFYGGMPMAVIGIGLEYKLAYVETAYYSLIGSQPNSTPIATQAVLTTFGVRIPL